MGDHLSAVGSSGGSLPGLSPKEGESRRDIALWPSVAVAVPYGSAGFTLHCWETVPWEIRGSGLSVADDPGVGPLSCQHGNVLAAPERSLAGRAPASHPGGSDPGGISGLLAAPAGNFLRRAGERHRLQAVLCGDGSSGGTEAGRENESEGMSACTVREMLKKRGIFLAFSF